MTTDLISRMQSVKGKADQTQADRENYAAYIVAMREYGWNDEDVAEYKAEVERIMKSGTEDEKAAAREFWKIEMDPGSEHGINKRIRRSIEIERKKAA